MKQIMRLLITVLLVGCFATSYAQRDSSVSQKLVGFDANTMLGQILPFSNFQTNQAFPAVIVRRLWNGKGYRASIGFSMDDDFLQNAYLSFGYTRLRSVTPKFGYTTGFEGRVMVRDDGGSGFVGVATYWGVEYKVNKVISLSTEAALQAGLGNVFQFSVMPPVHIQCHFLINR